MKKIITICLIIISIVIACTGSRQENRILLNPSDIPADVYTINTEQDTTLVTKNGALLTIPRGSLQAESGSLVTLEIKEAYSLEQMIKAGLTTQSNGELLSSGGMIYINAKGGKKVTFKKAVTVSIPSRFLDKEMQLFKGEKTENGTINWIDGVSLGENKTITEIENGQKIFMTNCASCHKIGSESTGPDLAHFLTRYNGEILAARGYRLHIPNAYAATDTSADYLNEYRPDRSKHWHNQLLYFCNLKKIYGSVGPAFPDLDDDELNQVYRYVQNESDKNNLPRPAIAYLDGCVDSCIYYNRLANVYDLQKEQALEKQRGLPPGKLVDEIQDGSTPGVPPNQPDTSTPDLETDIVDPMQYDAVYYQFSIETFGWFNIDVLIKGQSGTEESELFVRLVGEYREKVQVYLIIPSVKIYVQGGPADKDPSAFAFQYQNGKINLPQNARAYILAVTETNASIAFALQSFTTQKKQDFSLSLQLSTKEEFNKVLKQISADGLSISVGDSKYAEQQRSLTEEIRKVDSALKTIERFKPKNCDCNCPDEGSPIVSLQDIPAKICI